MHRTTLNMSEKTHQTNLNCDNVSQQIQVGNQEFKCIINLNTTVCANKSKHRRACRRKHRPRHTEGHTKQRAHKHNKAQRLKVAPRKKVEYSWKWGPRYNDEYRSDHGIPNPSAKERIAPNCYRTACWDRHECRKENDRRKNVSANIILIISYKHGVNHTILNTLFSA